MREHKDDNKPANKQLEFIWKTILTELETSSNKKYYFKGVSYLLRACEKNDILRKALLKNISNKILCKSYNTWHKRISRIFKIHIKQNWKQLHSQLAITQQSLLKDSMITQCLYFSRSLCQICFKLRDDDAKKIDAHVKKTRKSFQNLQVFLDDLHVSLQENIFKDASRLMAYQRHIHEWISTRASIKSILKTKEYKETPNVLVKLDAAIEDKKLKSIYYLRHMKAVSIQHYIKKFTKINPKNKPKHMNQNLTINLNISTQEEKGNLLENIKDLSFEELISTELAISLSDWQTQASIDDARYSFSSHVNVQFHVLSRRKTTLGILASMICEEKSEENLEFIIACHFYKKIKDCTLQKLVAQEIHDRYIRVTDLQHKPYPSFSREQINLGDSDRKRIDSLMKNGVNSNTFNIAIDEVSRMISAGVYRGRFKQKYSQRYTQFMHENNTSYSFSATLVRQYSATISRSALGITTRDSSRNGSPISRSRRKRSTLTML